MILFFYGGLEYHKIVRYDGISANNVNGQQVHCFRYITRKGENETVRVATDHKLKGRRHRKRFRKRWIEVVKKNLKSQGVYNLIETVQNKEVSGEV